LRASRLRSIRWRVALPYIVLIVLAVAGLVVLLSRQVRLAQTAELERSLTAGARVVGDSLADSLPAPQDPDALDASVARFADLLDARVTVIAIDGTVVGESHDDRTTMDNHRYRPEIQDAVSEGHGSSVRYSRTIGYDMMYVAVPVTRDDVVVGTARVALPLREVEANVAALQRVVLGGGLMVAIVAAALAVVIAEQIARPVRELTEVVERVAGGDLEARLLPVTSDEIGTLTSAFNTMSDRLQGTISSLLEERTQLTGILDNMDDGVVITDGDGMVRLINPAAVRILGVTEDQALGRPVAQVARDHRVISLWRACCETSDEQSDLVEVRHGGLLLQVIVTPLRDGGPKACLAILRDLTNVRRLETIRRDFISNISHELRTPLASLKALAETLRDGALNDPPAASRFLSQMETEVDSLAQMVRELLELSRIESGHAPLQMVTCPVAEIVIPPVERLRPLAERAHLSLHVALPADLPSVLADAERAQQVVSNLVHNAIKFTPPGGEVLVWGTTVRVPPDGDPEPAVLELRHGMIDLRAEPLDPGLWAVVGVDDTGVGIPAEDLPRVFERFYKADRARSGGGTGLGLAISKHLVQAHGGVLWARSVEGAGSTFCVALPALDEIQGGTGGAEPTASAPTSTTGTL
jgi:two-component system phosphate regulon sensor histidine kinase PhoR